MQAPVNTQTAWHPWLKPVGRGLAFTLLIHALAPLAAWAQTPGSTPANPVATQQVQRLAQWDARLRQARAEQQAQDVAMQRTPAQQGAEALRQAHELLQAITSTDNAGGARKANTADLSQHNALRSALQAAAEGGESAVQDMAQQRLDLQQRQVHADILARHDEAAAQVHTQVKSLQSLLQTAQPSLKAQGAPLPTDTLQRLQQFFAQTPTAPSPPRRTTQGLPWRTPQAVPRLPAETQTAWYPQIYPAQRVQLAQAGQMVGGVRFDIPPEPSQAPQDADLASVAEVELTPALRAKAAELGHNPVQIANWVHNHIQWQPTWGSIQGAQGTLDNLRGNAVDTASLTIALLRASGIPARYQMGTVDVPINQAMNWVGGVTAPQAALQLLAQGGIPARGIIEGGQLRSIRMQHVWVQAYVNWAPGRGSQQGGAATEPPTLNANGLPQHPSPNAKLNAWIALDTSFKQYQDTPGMNLAQAVPLNVQALLDAARSGATVNEAEGWVQNLNQAALQSQLNDYEQRLKAYIQTGPKGTNTTVGEVIGSRTIPARHWPWLSGQTALPVVSQATPLAQIPAAWQHQFSYRLQDETGQTVLTLQKPVYQLVGKRITLSYQPATAADADLIARYLPTANADGSPIRPEQLPSSLPGYLIRLKPQIQVDGQVVAQSSQALTMGKDLYGQGGFTQLYDTQQWDLSEDTSHVVGQASAIGLSAGGISAAQLSRLQERLSQTQATLQSGNSSAIAALSGEQLSGDLLSAALWSWFAAAQSHGQLSQNTSGVVEVGGLSYGLLHASAQAHYSWGVLRQVSFPGVNIDIGHMRLLAWAKDHDSQRWVQHNRLRGQHLSALEHAIPERFFNNPSQCNPTGTSSPTAGLPECPQGISSVSALQIAAKQGQRIYSLSPTLYNANPNIVQTELNAHSGATRQRISEALANGLEVTIHQRPITESSWKGAGYMIIDPVTGSGAYEIEGGSQGADLMTQEGAALALSPKEVSFGVMASAVLEAEKSAVAAQRLGMLLARMLPAVSLVFAASSAPIVLGLVVAIAVFVVMWALIAAAAAMEQDIRDGVNSSVIPESMQNQNWTPDNCVLAYPKLPSFTAGWRRHGYRCKTAGLSQIITRDFPSEYPSLTPLKCVPGLLPGTASPRSWGDPVDLKVFMCIFSW